MSVKHDSEQPGLEHVVDENFPEVVVPEHEPPHAMPAQSAPEYWQQKPAGPNVQEEPYRDKSAAAGEGLPSYSAQHGQSEPPASRMCGLKRKTFLLLCGVIVLVIVILAAVLGGVLGTRHSSSSSSPSPSQTSNTSTSSVPTSPGATSTPIAAALGSGLAITSVPGDSTLYSYYQASNGDIIEAEYANASFVHSSNVVVASSTDVHNGSALAAVAWKDGSGNLNRAIFYVDRDNNLLTKNTSSATWGQLAANITLAGKVTPSGTYSIAAMVDTSTSGLDGIRVIYGPANPPGTISNLTAIRNDFTGGGWITGASFFNGGNYVGATGTLGGRLAVLYYRNASSGLMLTSSASFQGAGFNTQWVQGISGPALQASTAIAAVRGSNSIDHIFYQQSTGQLGYATFDTTTEPGNSKRATSGIIDTQNLVFQDADFGTKIAAVYVDDSPIVMFQARGSHTVVYQSVLAHRVSNATAVT